MTSHLSEYRKKSYRPEIDGLRAISVLGVVLFHYQLGFSGGYVGVDVFFVISGYLITSIIVREIEEGTFSIRNFWVRRIRRIFPAVSILTASVLVAGLFILDSESIVDLAKSSVAQSFVVSNVFFWREAGYFSQASELKPLLHTWSLSIEEQFYVFLPICLLFLARFFKRGIVFVLILTMIVSFGLSIYFMPRFPSATFYLLPTRAWELLAGSVAAVAFQSLKLSRPVADILSALGLFMVVLSMLLYSNKTPFPGLYAIPPVLGATLFMITNSTSHTYTGRLLACRPVVFIGLISYSLYLWHWPIFSFSRHMLIDTDTKITSLLLFLTLIISIISWKYVENPFRSTNRLMHTGSAFLLLASVSTVLLIGSGWVILERGFPQRFNSNTSLIIEDAHWTGTDYKEEIGAPMASIRFGIKKGSTPDFVLWGDSHAMFLGDTVESVSVDLGLNGVGFITPACPPVPGIWMPRDSLRSSEDALITNKKRLDWILDQRVKHVILVGRWDAMYREERKEVTTVGEDNNPKRYMVVDSITTDVTRESSILALKRHLNQMVSELTRQGVTVWVILQIPEISQMNLAKNFSLKHRFPRLNGRLPDKSDSLEAYQNQRFDSLKIFESLESSNVRIIDPIDSFFPNGLPFDLFDSRAYYKDTNHLTRRGADRFLKPLIVDTLEKILNSRQ